MGKVGGVIEWTSEEGKTVRVALFGGTDHYLFANLQSRGRAIVK